MDAKSEHLDYFYRKHSLDRCCQNFTFKPRRTFGPKLSSPADSPATFTPPPKQLLSQPRTFTPESQNNYFHTQNSTFTPTQLLSHPKLSHLSPKFGKFYFHTQNFQAPPLKHPTLTPYFHSPAGSFWNSVQKLSSPAGPRVLTTAYCNAGENLPNTILFP